jgi:hypothetical protein
MRPRTKAIFDDTEIRQLRYYGFSPRKGKYLCAFANDCYEIYPYLPGGKRLYAPAYNNQRVYGPGPNLSRVLEEYCLRAADYEMWDGPSAQEIPLWMPWSENGRSSTSNNKSGSGLNCESRAFFGSDHRQPLELCLTVAPSGFTCSMDGRGQGITGRP